MAAASGIDPNLFASLARAYTGGMRAPSPGQEGMVPVVDQTGTNFDYAHVIVETEVDPNLIWTQKADGTKPIGVRLPLTPQFYGAAADGTTDDSAVLVARGSTPVYFPAGVTHTIRAVRSYTATNWRGDGTIHVNLSAGTVPFLCSGGSHRFDGLTVTGSNQASGAGDGEGAGFVFNVARTGPAVFTGCSISGFGAWSSDGPILVGAASSDVHVYYSKFFGNLSDGAHGADIISRGTRCSFIGNDMRSENGCAIRLNGYEAPLGRQIVAFNYAEKKSTHAYAIAYGATSNPTVPRDTIVIGNHAYDCMGSGVSSQGYHIAQTIVANTVSYCGGDLGQPLEIQANYQCSGAPNLGWSLVGNLSTYAGFHPPDGSHATPWPRDHTMQARAYSISGDGVVVGSNTVHPAGIGIATNTGNWIVASNVVYDPGWAGINHYPYYGGGIPNAVQSIRGNTIVFGDASEIAHTNAVAAGSTTERYGINGLDDSDAATSTLIQSNVIRGAVGQTLPIIGINCGNQGARSYIAADNYLAFCDVGLRLATPDVYDPLIVRIERNTFYGCTTGVQIPAASAPVAVILAGNHFIGCATNVSAGANVSVYHELTSSPKAVGNARIRIVSGTAVPTAGTWEAGSICILESGAVWQCAVGGTPGTWAPLTTTQALGQGSVTLNGATPVDVACTSIRADSMVSLMLTAVGGTYARPPTIAITAGVKFTVAGVAGDTSTYTWRVS